MYFSDHEPCSPGHLCCECRIDGKNTTATDAVEVEFSSGGRTWYALCKSHAQALFNRLHEGILREEEEQFLAEERKRDNPFVKALEADSKSAEALREEALCGMVR